MFDQQKKKDKKFTIFISFLSEKMMFWNYEYPLAIFSSISCNKDRSLNKTVCQKLVF